MMTTISVCVILVISSALDAIRDSNISRDPAKVSWIMWHAVKWGSVFPVWIALCVAFVPVVWWIPLSIISKISWIVGYQLKLDGLMMDFPFHKGE